MANKLSYEVFLTFNNEDRDEVEKIAIHLKNNAKLRPWFDQWELIPGESVIQNLERGLKASSTCAVFVGRSGEGPWQKREVEIALRQQIQHPDFRVIPVLLPDAPKQPELPSFLSGNMWVEFRESVEDDNALWCIECGIRGIAPGQGRPQPNGAEEILNKIFPSKQETYRQQLDELKFVNRVFELNQLILNPAGPQYLEIYAPAGYGKTCLLNQAIKYYNTQENIVHALVNFNIPSLRYGKGAVLGEIVKQINHQLSTPFPSIIIDSIDDFLSHIVKQKAIRHVVLFFDASEFVADELINWILDALIPNVVRILTKHNIFTFRSLILV